MGRNAAMLSGLPEFPEFTTLQPCHRKIVDAGFDSLGRESSEFTFNLYYLFLKASGASISRLGDSFIFRELCRGGGWCLLPPMLTEDMAGVSLEAMRIVKEVGMDARHLSSVTERMWQDIYKPTTLFTAQVDRDNCDYVYKRKDLAEMRGNRYHSQKNQINRFNKAYSWEYRSLTADLINDACLMAENWLERRGTSAGPLSFGETAAMQQGLRQAFEFGMTGGVILIGGKVQAAALGERLNKQTAVVHFEKANPDLRGLSQLITREFAAHEFLDCCYINREMDLGNPGLRTAKTRLRPDHMVVKYALALAGDAALTRHYDYQH